MRSKLNQIMGTTKLNKLIKFIKSKWVLDDNNEVLITEDLVNEVEQYINKNLTDYIEPLGSVSAWLPILINDLTGNMLIPAINTVTAETTYSVVSTKDASGFIKSVDAQVRSGSVISEESVRHLNPSIQELEEGMNILTSFTFPNDKKPIFVRYEFGDKASDLLEGAIRGLDKLLTSKMEISEVEDQEVQNVDDITLFYPTLEHTEVEYLMEHKVEHYIEERRPQKWLQINAKDLVKGNMDGVVEAILPMSLTPEQMIRRIYDIAKVIQQSKLLYQIYDAIISPRILKGRTQYNTRAVLYVSEVIQEIEKVTTRVAAPDRFYVTLPLLALTLAELDRTGLMAIDFDFTIMVPIAEKIPTNQICLKYLLLEECKKSFFTYSDIVKKVEFGESIVSSYDIAQQLVSFRHILGEDLMHMEHTNIMYDTFKQIASAMLFKLPIKLLQLHPSLYEDSAIKRFLSIYDFFRECTEDQTMIKVLDEKISIEEAREVLNWFNLRIGYITEHLRPIDKFQNSFTITSRRKMNGSFSNAFIIRDTVSKHENSVANFVQYGGNNAFAVYSKRRETFENKMNSISNQVLTLFTKDNMLAHLDDELNRGYLPPYMGMISASEREQALLACSLNGGKCFVGYKAVVSTLKNLASNELVASVHATPIDPVHVYPLETNQLMINGQTFITQQILVTDVKTFLWALVQERKIHQAATTNILDNLSWSKLKEGVRSVMPYKVEPRSLEGAFNLQIKFDQQEFDIGIETKRLFQTEVVVGSSILPRFSASSEMIRNLKMLELLADIGFTNLKQVVNNDSVIMYEKYELAVKRLQQLFNSSMELKVLVNKLVAYIEIQIARKLGQTTTDLDILNVKHMRNQIGAQTLAAVNDMLCLMPSEIIQGYIDLAVNARTWYNQEIFV